MTRFLVFLCVSDSRIFGREVSESRIFVFWLTVSTKTMINLAKFIYFIKNVR